MPKMITQEKIVDAVRNSTFIKNGDPECAEGVKYDFRLSSRILKASFGRPVDTEKLTETEKKDLFVEPGEMVFALTEERLLLPANMMAELSPKRKLSHAGVLVIGGFCIDPRYEGRLLIGLFNFSSTRFPLRPKKKVIAATFYQLEDGELGDFPKPEAAVEDFPDELIEVMQKYQPSSVLALADAVENLRLELENLRKDIHSHDEWYRRFEQSLERHDKQIEDLLSGLASEKEARIKGEDSIGIALRKIEQTLSWLRGAAWAVTSLAALIGVPLLIAWLLKVFKFR